MTHPAASHTNTRIPLARQLLALGHHVGWLCIPAAGPRLAQLGVEVLGVTELPPIPRMVGESRIRVISEPDVERSMFRHYYLGPLLDTIEPLRAIIREFRPDVVALDGTYYFFVVATQLEQIPWACISSGLWLLKPSTLEFRMRSMVESFADERRSFFERHGMDPDFRLLECLSPALNLVSTTPEFIGDAGEWPPDTVAIGPTIATQGRGDEVDFPWHRLRSDGGPIVYLTFGTGFYWNPEIIRNAAIACAELGAQLVTGVMDLADHETTRSLPGDPVVVRYAPQLELLPKVTAFINHGGAASVMEGLYFGVPQLVVPISLDQPVQAYFMTRSGAGAALDPAELTAATCRDALGPMLEPDSSFHERATVIRESYRAANGPVRAAELLLQLAGTVPRDLRG